MSDQTIDTSEGTSPEVSEDSDYVMARILWVATRSSAKGRAEMLERAEAALSSAAMRHYRVEVLRRSTAYQGPDDDSDPQLRLPARLEAVAHIEAEEARLVERHKAYRDKRAARLAKKRQQREREEGVEAVDAVEAVGETSSASPPQSPLVAREGTRGCESAEARTPDTGGSTERDLGLVGIPPRRAKWSVYSRMAVYWMQWIATEAGVPGDSHQARAWRMHVQSFVLGRRGNERITGQVVDPESFARERMVTGLGIHIQDCGFCDVDDVIWTRAVEVIAQPFPGVPAWQLRQKPFVCKVCGKNFGTNGITYHQRESGHHGVVRRARGGR